jgi:hypothetical protein
MKTLQELAFLSYLESLFIQSSLSKEELLFQTRVQQLGAFLEDSLCRNGSEIYLKGCLNKEVCCQYKKEYNKIYKKAFNAFQILKKELTQYVYCINHVQFWHLPRIIEFTNTHESLISCGVVY